VTRNVKKGSFTATCWQCGQTAVIEREEGEILEYKIEEDELWIEYSFMRCSKCGAKDFSV